MDTETLKRWVDIAKNNRIDEATRIRLAEGVKRNVAQNPALLGILGLTQKELDRFPKR